MPAQSKEILSMNFYWETTRIKNISLINSAMNLQLQPYLALNRCTFRGRRLLTLAIQAKHGHHEEHSLPLFPQKLHPNLRARDLKVLSLYVREISHLFSSLPPGVFALERTPRQNCAAELSWFSVYPPDCMRLERLRMATCLASLWG